MPKNTPPGPAVDSSGQTVVDPTINVTNQLDAAVKRLDDLREASERRQDGNIEAEGRHVRELSALRESHARELREKEAERIDAIRLVDVNAVARAAEVSAAQAAALAAQVALSADAMRVQVAAAAQAAQESQARYIDPIQKDIADLRRAQYEQQGQRAQVTDSRAKSSTSGLWIGLGVSAFLGFIGMIIGISGFIFAITGR
jgi:uncharacterized protein YkuJ